MWTGALYCALRAAIFIIMYLPQRSSRPEQLLPLVMAVFSIGTECSDAAPDFEISEIEIRSDDGTEEAPEVADYLAIGMVSELSAQREIVDFDFDFGWRFSKGETSGAGKVDFDDSTRGKPASKSTGKPLKP